VRIVRVRQVAALLGAVAVAGAAGAAPAMAAPSSRTVSASNLGHAARQHATQHATQPAVKLPYKDPNQAGWLTLCGTNLKPITQGSITSMPFVWRVVSSVPAPAAYWIKGAKAQLFAYQPRPYTPAGAWSGAIMAAASEYSNRQHPMAQFTPIDEPLTYMTDDFHPIWDHLIELRLYLGAPDRPEDVMGYGAADIQVIGNTWHLVAGGHASCTSGKVESVEVLDGMPGARGLPKSSSGAAAESGTSSGSSTSTAAGPAGSGSKGDSSAATAANVASATHTSSAGPVAAVLGVAVLAVAALLVAAAVSRRRRRSAG
jgi:hypothetical protein